MNNFIFLTSLIIFTLGIYKILISSSYWSKIIGISSMQSSILIFYIAIGKAAGGITPVKVQGDVIYSSPIPQVLMLTAIVVGFANITVALKLVSQIKE